MADIPSIPIMVVYQANDNLFMEGPYLAYIITNPDIRTTGYSEEEAIARLKKLLMNRLPQNKLSVKMMNIVLDELVIKEVHDS